MEDELYTLEQVQNMCYWAVKYANERMKRGAKTLSKAHLDQYVEENIDELKDEG